MNWYIWEKNLSLTVVVLNPPFSLLSQPSFFSAWQSPCWLVPSRFPRECKSKGTCTLFEWYLQVCCQGSSEIQHENNFREGEIKIGTRGRRKYMKTDYTEQPWGEDSGCTRSRGVLLKPSPALPKHYPDIQLETAITWDRYQTLQLLLKVHNVFAQLDVIHPVEREKAQSETCKSHPMLTELDGSHMSMWYCSVPGTCVPEWRAGF